MQRCLLALALAGACLAASAQAPAENPDWKEVEAPPPPPLRTTGLVPLEVVGTTLHFGIDPASVRIGGDGIVRYVVVATSDSGAVNAMYEGLRCDAGQVKVYARHTPGSGWTPARDPQWQPLAAGSATRHSLAMARDGACYGTAPNTSPTQIVQDLRAPVERRFERGGVNR